MTAREKILFICTMMIMPAVALVGGVIPWSHVYNDTLGRVSRAVHGVGRRNYCAQACSDARTCQFFPLPDNCEASCKRGHRTIELPRTCQQLRHNVDEAGYLW